MNATRSARRLGAVVLASAAAAALLGAGPCDPWVVPPAALTPPPWPEWVLRPWVWENAGTTESALALVDGYLDRDVPTGAVIIDAPWATAESTFEFDPSLYPDPQTMVDEFHARGVKVFVWSTSMINTDAPNFDFAVENEYVIQDLFGRPAVVPWWRGEGALLDYTNPDALAWWHAMMDGVLDLGIDGWKVDGTDPYILFVELFGLGAYGHAGHITRETYSDLVYRDFFEYTRARRGPATAITARPFDSLFGLIGLFFAPRDVNFAGWVGDQDNTFPGLRNALTNMLTSADAGYVNFGSDIGGFRSPDAPSKEVFLRWAQLGAFSPIMENGGGGEHRPWAYDAETVDIYRRFARIHEELAPYLYGQGAAAYPAGLGVMRRAEGAAADEKWQFLLGSDLFVAALHEPGGARVVRFPEGADWVDLWDGTPHAGASRVPYVAPLDRYPVFARRGAMIPLRAGSDALLPGGEALAGGLTVLAYPTDGVGAADVYEEKGNGVQFTYEMDGARLTLTASAHDEPIVWVLQGVGAPASVRDSYGAAIAPAATRAAFDASERGWYAEPGGARLWVKGGSAAKGLHVEVRFAS
ncbi:MAG: hypothetical protein KC466_02140 [Myxococcales bacterium]|nr:hypothetical protein [Myxococcales bacterium]